MYTILFSINSISPAVEWVAHTGVPLIELMELPTKFILKGGMSW